MTEYQEGPHGVIHRLLDREEELKEKIEGIEDRLDEVVEQIGEPETESSGEEAEEEERGEWVCKYEDCDETFDSPQARSGHYKTHVEDNEKSKKEILADKAYNWLKEQDMSHQGATIGTAITDKEVEVGVHPYSTIMSQLNLDDRFSSEKVGNEKFFFTDEEQMERRKNMSSEQKIKEELGEREFKLRAKAISTLMPEEAGDTSKVQFKDFRGVYEPSDREISKEDAWLDIVTSEDFRRAFQKMTNIPLEFSIEKTNDSRNPVSQYTLFIERGEKKDEE